MSIAFPFPERKPLKGQYCTLEPYNDSIDGQDLWAVIQNHREIFDFLPYGPWDSESEFRNWLVSALKRWPDQICFVVKDPSGKPLGCEWLHDISTEHGSIEIGGIFFSPALQRTRMSTESFYLLASYIFEKLNYRRLQWRCDNANEKSKNAALRFGFQFEGIFRQHMLVKGQNRDTIWYSILNTEWPKRKSCFEAWLAPSNFDKSGLQKTPLAR